jgi:hypothetical protein
MTTYEKRFENIAEFLADTEAMPIDAVIAELQSANVNVSQFIAEVKAIAAAPSRGRAALQFTGDLARRSKEELMKLLEELESGPFGSDASPPLSAAARTRSLSRLSDKELRERIETIRDNRPAHESGYTDTKE